MVVRGRHSSRHNIRRSLLHCRRRDARERELAGGLNSVVIRIRVAREGSRGDHRSGIDGWSPNNLDTVVCMGVPDSDGLIPRASNDFVPSTVVRKSLCGVYDIKILTRQIEHSKHCLCDPPDRLQQPCLVANAFRELCEPRTFSSSPGLV